MIRVEDLDRQEFSILVAVNLHGEKRYSPGQISCLCYRRQPHPIPEEGVAEYRRRGGRGAASGAGEGRAFHPGREAGVGKEREGDAPGCA
jgi:hypothetical protein